MQVIPEHHQSIIDWAESLPKVTAVFLLGDRAHGKAKPDSDIELGLFLGGTDSWWDLLTYLNHRRAWRVKLEKLLGLRVHLELMNHEPPADVSHPSRAAPYTLWRRG
jgi:predicted nucleotidyltransferase